MEKETVIFILLVLFGTYIVFRIFKKTVKEALRALIVLIIFAITIAGMLAIWNLEGFELYKKLNKIKKDR